jgi:hypothetical protein
MYMLLIAIIIIGAAAVLSLSAVVVMKLAETKIVLRIGTAKYKTITTNLIIATGGMMFVLFLISAAADVIYLVNG